MSIAASSSSSFALFPPNSLLNSRPCCTTLFSKSRSLRRAALARLRVCLKQDGPAEELDRASLLAALTRPVLERLVLLFRGAASEDEQIDAAAVLCCVSDTQSAHWVAEAGATNAAVCNLRSEDAGEALKKLLSSCAGASPELTAGVLLPPVLSVASQPADRRAYVVNEAAELVHLICSHSPRAAIRLKSTASALTTVVVSAQTINIGPASALPLSPLARLDTDSLSLCFSFLCGCDWSRTMRVCRRWVGLRFKPASWPSSLPCVREVARVVETMTLLLANDGTVEAACMALSSVPAYGLRLFIEGGALPRVARLLHKQSSEAVHLALLRLCKQMASLSERVHASLMASKGVLEALFLILFRSSHASVRALGITVLAKLCFYNPAQNRWVLQSGVLPIIMGSIRSRDAIAADDELLADHPSAALAAIALRGTNNDREALLHQGALPLLCTCAVFYCARGAATPVAARLAGEARSIVGLLTAMSLILRAAALDASAAGANSLQSLVTRECGPRSTFDSMLEHWSGRVRDAVTKFQREFYEAPA